MEFLLIIAAFAIIVIVAGYYSKKAAEARTAALAALAAQKGLQFMPGLAPDTMPGGFFDQLFSGRANSDEARILSWFQGFHPFGQGHSPEVRNVVYGQQGEVYWVEFDYSYKVTTNTGRGSSTTTYPFTIVCARLPVLLPPLSMEPENILLRIGNKLGLREMTFESEEFNRRYFIRCQDEKGAYDLLHPRAIEYLLAQPIRHWQMGGPQIIIAQSRYQDVATIDAIMREIAGFAALLPNYVKQDHGFVPQWTGPF